MVLRHWYHGAPCVAGADQLKSFFSMRKTQNQSRFFSYITALKIVLKWMYVSMANLDHQSMWQWAKQDFPAISNHYTTSMPELEDAQNQFESELVQWMMERSSLIVFPSVQPTFLSSHLTWWKQRSSFLFFHQVEPPKYHSVGCLQWGMGWI